MKAARGESKLAVSTKRLEVEIDEKVAEQLLAMEGHTKIPKGELITIALKRFIATHKDYFPEDKK